MIAVHRGGLSGQDSVAIAILLFRPFGAVLREHPHSLQ